MDLRLYQAQVIDIDDSDEQCGIVIKVLPEMKDVKQSDLPKAYPFSLHNSTHEFENDLPEVNSLIYVLIDKYWKRFYYLQNQFFYDFFKFSTITTALNKATEITNKDYKNIKFRLYADGGLEFHNKNDGSHGFIHKSGSYSIFDKDGNIIIDSDTKKVKVNGNAIELNGNTKQFVTWTELNSALQSLILALNSHTHLVASVGAPTGPASASTPPITFSIDISSAQTTTIKTGG